MSTAAHVVRCPVCSKSVEWGAQSPHRPFCSERCRKIDLGAWAAEQYRVPQSAPADDPDIPPQFPD